MIRLTAAVAFLLTFADGTEFYTLVAVRHYSTFYAEWGAADGMEYEDRYEAVEFEVYSDGVNLGSVAAVQHWFAGDRSVLPAPGDTIAVEAFELETRALPTSMRNVFFSDLVPLNQPRANPE
jgi:hypothetical protein